MARSVQDLLEERRQNVLEQSHSDDVMTRRMLQAHIDYIDREIEDADRIDRLDEEANTDFSDLLRARSEAE